MVNRSSPEMRIAAPHATPRSWCRKYHNSCNNVNSGGLISRSESPWKRTSGSQDWDSIRNAIPITRLRGGQNGYRRGSDSRLMGSRCLCNYCLIARTASPTVTTSLFHGRTSNVSSEELRITGERAETPASSRENSAAEKLGYLKTRLSSKF